VYAVRYTAAVSAELGAEIKRFAVGELGFSLAGVTTADPPAGGRFLAGWLEKGCHGTMAYLARNADLRLDPRRFLSRARTVICVAMSYNDPPGAPPAGPDDAVSVAAYARRPDYHRVIRRRLVRLGRFLAERVPGASWRPAVDTAPVLEKELAARAGLGWIGKNTCLVNRTLGSWTLLGELVTDVELAPDRPETDHCGRCSACLDACPTGALTAPRRLDARRCLAYATIEHRGPLPTAVLPSLGDRLFGCDSCQDACPWNRRARPACASPLAPRPRLAALSRRQLAHIQAPEWAALTAGTPLRRLDHLRLRRNLEGTAHPGPGKGSLGVPSLTFRPDPTIKPAPEGPERSFAEVQARRTNQEE
jgi:epoxyqueuosine reductase